MLGVKQSLTFCENGSLCTHSNFFRVKNKINCALKIHKHNQNIYLLEAFKRNMRKVRGCAMLPDWTIFFNCFKGKPI